MFYLPEEFTPAMVGVLGLLLAITLNVLGFDFGTSSFKPYGGSSEDSYAANPVPTDATIIAVGDSILVNGIRIGQNINSIRTQLPQFPAEGTNVALEDGTMRRAVDYQDATYYFDGTGILHRIKVANTPEYLSSNSTLADAQRLYGQAIHSFCSISGSPSTTSEDEGAAALALAENRCNGDSYAVFSALSGTKLVWLIHYDYSAASNYAVRDIYLDDGLDYYRAQAAYSAATAS